MKSELMCALNKDFIMVPLKEVETVEQLRSRVDELRSRRGTALLDGEPAEGITAEIVRVSERVEALDDLHNATRKRDREKAAERFEAARGGLQKNLDTYKAEIIKEAAVAEKAMRVFAASHNRTRALYVAASKVQHDLAGSIPTPWNLTQLAERRGFLVAAILASMGGSVGGSPLHRLGCLSWSLHGAFPAELVWRDVESKILKQGTEK